MFQPKLLSALILLVASVATTCGAALAQSSEPPERPKRTQDPDTYYHAPNSMHGKTVVLPINTTFEGRVDQTISSAHSRPGARFHIVIDSPVIVNGNDVVIPTGSKIIGEVVEAVPASDVPKQKWQDKRLIHGKLRVQISGLQTPDGAMYPLVAQLQGEVWDKSHEYLNMYKNPLGTNVGYMGTGTSFEATNANRQNAEIARFQHRGAPTVMSKQDFMKDEVLGMGYQPNGMVNNLDFSSVRSLVLKGRDYFIYNGSPLTVKVTAPFKIGLANPGQGVSVGSIGEEPRDPQLPPPSASRTNGGAETSYGAPESGNSGMPQRSAEPPSRNAVPPDSF
jgi:hypothetical protein